MHRIKSLKPLVVLALICFAASQNSFKGASSSPPENLYIVKKIYIWRPQSSDLPAKAIAEGETMRANLQQELTSFGFIVVDDEAKADATLVVNEGAWITLDGPQPDPPKYSFECQLSLLNKQQVWHTSFNISGRDNKDRVNQKATQKIANKLFKAWRRSAKMAGLVVGDKIIL